MAPPPPGSPVPASRSVSRRGCGPNRFRLFSAAPGAAGSRPNLFPMIVAVAGLAGFWRWRQGDTANKRILMRSSAAALLPVSAVMLAHLIINQLRFGDWTEFGRHYQMTYPTLDPGLRFVVPDSYAYLFAPLQLS